MPDLTTTVAAPEGRRAGRREAILDAAARLIARRGVRGLRVEEVATEAGVSPPLLYYHFESRAGLVRATLDAHGALDVLVNNAGASFAAPAQDVPTEEWDRLLALNLTGPFLLSRHAYPALRAGAGGAIINIASIAAFTTPPRRIGYVAAKAGLVALTKALAGEWAPEIRVNAVVPGYIETDLVAGLLERGVVDRDVLEARTPTGRLGRPEEVARAVAFLASDDAEYVTGATLPVDGGWLVFGQNL